VWFQYVFDRVRCNHVAEIGECALDSVVAPGDILARHREYQIGDLLPDTGSSWSLARVRPLLRDELAVPGKKSVWCHKRLYFIEYAAARDLGFHGQSYSLFVGEPKSLSFELILEDTVLFDEVEGMYNIDHCTLQPTRNVF